MLTYQLTGRPSLLAVCTGSTSVTIGSIAPGRAGWVAGQCSASRAGMLAGAGLAVMIFIATLALLTVAAYFSGQSKEFSSV